ncbi:MAG: V-type ATP synthase subunit E family protein [Thermoplasmata archaeon]
MGLEKLIEDILRKGEERAQEIIRQGERERDEPVRSADAEMKTDRERAQKRAEAQITQLEQHELSSAELESRKMLLSAQREVLEDLRERILAELAVYPEDKKQMLYAKLFSKAEGILGDCYVYSNKADSALLKRSPRVASGGTIDCLGGLVFETMDRTVRLDYRFETMLEEIWGKKMNEIYTQLFG